MSAEVDYSIDETNGENNWFVRVDAVGVFPCVSKSRAVKLATILNAHDDLVAALKYARKCAYLIDPPSDVDDIIDAALAKAEGKDA